MSECQKDDESKTICSEPDAKSECEKCIKRKNSINPLSILIETFVLKILDIQECAQRFIPSAGELHNQTADLIKLKLKEAEEEIGSEDAATSISGIRKMREAKREVKRLLNSNAIETLERSLFVNLFSSFDQFTGELIQILFSKKTELFNQLNNEVKLSEILQFEDMVTLRESILTKEIENIRRKSYEEQFESLEKIFSMNLRKFTSWPEFIENSQRRNLFTHCDGIVSQQYLTKCKQVSYKFSKETVVGERLDIGAKYFHEACCRLIEVSVMLGQTLWRKVAPSEIEKADDNLSSIIFDLLIMEYWSGAIKLSEFALNLPKVSSETTERINRVNYAIALSNIGKKNSAIKLLNEKDWSASTYEFKLAHAVLTSSFDEAKNLMIKIGKEGELISEVSYIDWPLFVEFRETTQFREAYEMIFGYPFSSIFPQKANEVRCEVEESISKSTCES